MHDVRERLQENADELSMAIYDLLMLPSPPALDETELKFLDAIGKLQDVRSSLGKITNSKEMQPTEPRLT